MKSLKASNTYAVVDLETTGTNLDGSQRIIQFACVLVEAGQIVNQFSTLINPLRPLSPEVEKLTGLKQKDLKKAPSFDEVAASIYALLQGTIFVAHNIQFDYRFLNLELERVGYPALELKGIDTVQLAQILLPTQLSYRLGDLGKALKIEHEHPHHADSDAYVTAKLLLLLLAKLRELPRDLLVTLNKLAGELVYDTGACFKEALAQKDETEILDADLLQVAGIILKRPHFQSGAKLTMTYPLTEQEKRQQFTEIIDYRSEQVRLMDDIEEFSHSKARYFLAQAPTGLGKTLAYLYPAAYLALGGQKVVLAVPTNTLQEQVLTTSIPIIEQLVGKLRVVTLKGSQNYLNLEKFWQSLRQAQGKYTRIVQMKILVWLSQTETGDLTELHLLKTKDSFFEQISHQGIEGLDKTSPFYQVDFVRRQEVATKNADIVITNQSYLLNHANDFASLGALLILDEAQHLIDLAASYNRQVLDLDAIKILADSLLVKMESQVSLSFEQLVATGFMTRYSYQQIKHYTQVIDHSVMDVRSRLIQYFYRKEAGNEIYLSNNKLRGFVKAHLGEIKQIEFAFEKLLNLNSKLEGEFIQASRKQALTQEEEGLLLDYFTLVTSFNKELSQWSQLDLELIETKQNKGITWLSLNRSQANAHLRLNFGLLEGKDYLATNIYQKFAKVILLGASVLTPKTKSYVLNQLDLPADLKIHTYKSQFNYRKQAQVLVARDAPTVDQLEYSQYLVQTINQIVTESPRQTMVLFNSLEMVAKIYQGLVELGLTAKRDVLAQGINGGVNKLKKRFALSQTKDSILLATGSFFEGIDLPEDKLELVIVTRLPFTPPDSLYNQVRYQRLKAAGKNPFSVLALPEAIIKLKQAFGRLIRTKNDRGVFVLLDSRFVTKRYGSEFNQAFPKECSLQVVLTKQVVKEVKDFFES